MRRRQRQPIDPEMESVKLLRKIDKSLKAVVCELECIAGLLMKGTDVEKIRAISAAVTAQKAETEAALERNTPPDTPAAS
jgi:hypothetical protein